jgi:hypothetical protein
MFLIKQLVVPLSSGILGLRIDTAVHQGQEIGRDEALGKIGHTEVRHGMTTARMMARQTPYYWTSPVMPDPDRLFLSQGIEQFEHVLDDMLKRVIRMGVIDA